LKALRDRVLALDVDNRHVVIIEPPRLQVLDFEDAHFNLDRSILLPDTVSADGAAPVLDERRVTGLGVIFAALVHVKRNPSQRLLSAGHADASGSVEYNQTLTDQRAENAVTLLRGDRERWRTLSNETSHPDDIQHILAWQAAVAGWDCDPGPITGTMNSATTAAVRRFQERYNAEVDAATTAGADSPFTTNIDIDGDPGPQTWGAFFDVYMIELMRLLQVTTMTALREHQARALPFDDLPAFVGCSEHFPFATRRRTAFQGDPSIERPSKNPPDRRVELLFFDPVEKPELECHAGPQCQPDLCPIYRKFGYIQEPLGIPTGLQLLEVVIRFQVLDPEGNPIQLPEGFDVEVTFSDGTTRLETLDSQGILTFETARDKDSFTFALGTEGTQTFVIVETVDGALQVSKGARGDLESAFARGARHFLFPAKLKAKHLDWQVPSTAKFEAGSFTGLRDPQTEVGQRGAPLDMVLVPLWQHFAFHYFDRWHQVRRSVPQPRPAAAGTEPIVLKGFDFRGASLKLNESGIQAEAVWDLVAGDETVHCVPWIQRRDTVVFDEDGDGLDDFTGVPVNGSPSAEVDRPGPSATVAWILPKSTFIRAEGEAGSGAKERVLETIESGHAHHEEVTQAGVPRLRYTDLPAQWHSRDYFSRRSNDAAGTRTKHQDLDASTHDNPAIIDLDDIVLCGHIPRNPFDADAPEFSPEPGPFSDQEDERFTIYDAELRPYKSDASEPYFTKAASLSVPPQGPVIFDHPDDTRLVTAGVEVFECFDQRTAASAKFEGHPVGARAAVSWISRRHGAFVSFDGNYSSPGADDTKSTNVHFGDSVTVALRCCGHDGDVEIFRILQFASVRLEFPSSPTKGTAVTPTPSDAQIRTTTRDSLVATTRRWNGGDAQNADPFVFEVRDGGSVTARGHYHPILVRGGPNTHSYRFSIANGVRASMARASSWKPGDLVAESGGRFTAAHEWGHGFGLPDEYIENLSNASLHSDGIVDAARSPGCPYSFDPEGMMSVNIKPRAHSMWHLALWMSEGGHTFDGKTDWTVVHGSQRYKLAHSPPAQSRVRFPILSRTNVTRGARGNFDIFAYAIGADGFNAGDGLFGATVAAPFDLLVVVRVKMAWSLLDADERDYDEGRKLLRRAQNAIHIAFNRGDRRVLARGTFEGKSVRARLLFSPRFISRAFPTGSSAERTDYLQGVDFDPKLEQDYIVFVNGLVSEHGIHCEVAASDDPDPRGFVASSGPIRQANVDTGDIDDDIIDVFGQLVGLRDPTTDEPRDFAPFVDMISGFSRQSMEFLG